MSAANAILLQKTSGADEAQRRAADPARSIWVGASAGSGKTKVLTDRLLRLLLPREDGRPATPPSRILCLTFTKAAAREMALRLSKRLSAWAVMDDAALSRDMNEKLLGRTPQPAEMAAARRLFADVVDAPGGLKIMTIHSFCQSVLNRFPLEAGLTPPFNPLEDSAAAGLLNRARDETVAAARRKPDSPEGRALHRLAIEAGEESFSRLLQDVVRESRQLRTLRARFENPEALHDAICAALGVAAGGEEALYAGACADGGFDEAGLRAACRAMMEHGTEKTDRPRAQAIQVWLDHDQARRRTFFATYSAAYLTGGGEIRASLMTKKLTVSFPAEESVLRAEAERILILRDRLKAAACARLTTDLMILGGAVWQRYEALKQARAALDFDDLINRTLDLLETSAMAGWVMYKLDGGLDHILIDEAQDTNPEQWRIVAALCEDFFSGLGVRPETVRTIFTVGDEKQSIYSFQRAAPEKFQEMRTVFADKVQAAKQKWRNEDLNISFRSVPSVLKFVDQVFLEEPVRRGLGLSKLHHISHRAGAGGLVEVWPLFASPARETRSAWSPPVNPSESHSGAARLAEHIGATIRGWLDSGEPLVARGRPVAPGDILILVRRRTAFVNQLIRALKTRNIPVSGIDRMVLKDQLAVQDLTAAAQFALLPEDDLTLACLLKSPLVGWTDADLERVAPSRPATLWAAIRQIAPPALGAWLDALIARGASDHPYEFFSRLLQQPCPADPVSGLHAMTGRLGVEALDPLEEFLNAALAFEAGNIPALQGFLLALQQGDSEIKREQAEAGAAVRIMTIHGAKGLQAPVVILPDTTRTTRTAPGGSAQRLIWPDKSGLAVPLWSPRADADCETYARLMARQEDRRDEEYRRLFYVALTRAEDRLYVAGYTGRRPALPESWYDYAATAMRSLKDVETAPFAAPLLLQDDDAAAPVLHRLSNPQKDALPEKAAAAKTALPLQDDNLSWLRTAPAEEPDPPHPLTPSRPAEAEPAAQSPLAEADTYRFRRGNVTHKLLQLLPDLPATRRSPAALSFVARHAADLPDSVRAAILDETMAILENPAWAPLFGPDSLAEVPVTGRAGMRLVSGQIDRLLVTDAEIWIVDYKTNRPPPAAVAGIPALYQRQMQAYSDIVAAIYPGRRVRAFLLWTDGPRLMEISVPGL